MKHIAKLCILFITVAALTNCERQETETSESKNISIILDSILGTKSDDISSEKWSSIDIDDSLSLNIKVSDNLVGLVPETKGTNTTSNTFMSLYSSEGFKVYAEKQDDPSSVLLANETFFCQDGLWIPESKVSWPGYATEFYAWAPGDAGSLSSDNKLISYHSSTVNEDQTDFLIAKTTAAQDFSGALPLTFQHALCEIKFAANETLTYCSVFSLKIKNIKLDGNYNIATGEWTIPEDAEIGEIILDLTDGSNYSSRDYTNQAYPNITNDSQVFFVIPQVCTPDTKIEFEYGSPHSSRTYSKTVELSLPDNFSFEAGKAITFKLGGQPPTNVLFFTVHRNGYDYPTKELHYYIHIKDYDDYYHPDYYSQDTGLDIDFPITVFSASVPREFVDDSGCVSPPNQAGPYQSLFHSIDFISEYSSDNGQTWHDVTDDILDLSIVQGFKNSYGCYYKATWKVPKSKLVQVDDYNHIWAKSIMTGSQSDPVDLSMMGFGGDDITTKQNTANCYPVKGPGFYKFPCVYGNAIVDGNDNPISYDGCSNVLGASIQSPYVLKDLLDVKDYIGNGRIHLNDLSDVKAEIMWCDTKYDDELIVQDVLLTADSSNPEDAYISFKTSSGDKLIRGNAVIVLYKDGLERYEFDETNKTYLTESTVSTKNGKYDEGEALWSWHIWVTDDYAGTDSYPSFMKRPLGSCQSKLHGVRPHNSEYLFRFTQNGTDAAPLYLTLDIDDEFEPIVEPVPYYQFGRKNPFIPRDMEVYNKPKTCYDGSGNEITTPVKALMNTSRFDNDAVPGMVDRYPGTMFNANLNGKGFKTINDPSPYGYKVPSMADFPSPVTLYFKKLSGDLPFFCTAAGYITFPDDGSIDEAVYSSGYPGATTTYILSTDSIVNGQSVIYRYNITSSEHQFTLNHYNNGTDIGRVCCPILDDAFIIEKKVNDPYDDGTIYLDIIHN